jgi:predicted nucleic acid-binding protein
LSISVVTYGEILEGIYYGSAPEEHERDFRTLLQGVDRVPLSDSIFERFARLRGQLRQRGRLIGDLDLLIAATALEHDLVLVTRNRRHFDRIPDLRLYE